MPNHRDTPILKTELRDFISSISNNFQQYHARKENMAWVATTVYLGGLLGINSLLFENGKLVTIELGLKWGFVIVEMITFIFAITFISKQLSDRTVAAHINASCNEVLGQLLDPEFMIKKDLLHVSDFKERGHSFLFPKILIERLNAPVRQPHRILWNYVAPYLAVIAWTTASIMFIALS